MPSGSDIRPRFAASTLQPTVIATGVSIETFCCWPGAKVYVPLDTSHGSGELETITSSSNSGSMKRCASRSDTINKRQTGTSTNTRSAPILLRPTIGKITHEGQTAQITWTEGTRRSTNSGQSFISTQMGLLRSTSAPQVLCACRRYQVGI